MTSKHTPNVLKIRRLYEGNPIDVSARYVEARDEWLLLCKRNGRKFDERYSADVWAEAADMVGLAMHHKDEAAKPSGNPFRELALAALAKAGA